jgi:hypothetical protein
MAFERPAASEDAYLAEVSSNGYFDRVGLTLGEPKSNVAHELRSELDPQEVFAFLDYGYLRQTKTAQGAARWIARGPWIGFRVRCPQSLEVAALEVNGKEAQYRREGDYLVMGEVPQSPKPGETNSAVSPLVDPSAPAGNQSTESIPRAQPLKITAPKDPVRLALRDSRQVALQLRNESPNPQGARIRLSLPHGFLAEPSEGGAVHRGDRSDGGSSLDWELPPLAPHEATSVHLRLSSDGTGQAGIHPATVQVTGTKVEDWSIPVPLLITLGPVLVEDNSFPTFGEYVIYAPRYTLRLSKRYGTSRFLLDDANRPVAKQRSGIGGRPLQPLPTRFRACE